MQSLIDMKFDDQPQEEDKKYPENNVDDFRSEVLIDIPDDFIIEDPLPIFEDYSPHDIRKLDLPLESETEPCIEDIETTQEEKSAMIENENYHVTWITIPKGTLDIFVDLSELNPSEDETLFLKDVHTSDPKDPEHDLDTPPIFDISDSESIHSNDHDYLGDFYLREGFEPLDESEDEDFDQPIYDKSEDEEFDQPIFDESEEEEDILMEQPIFDEIENEEIEPDRQAVTYPTSEPDPDSPIFDESDDNKILDPNLPNFDESDDEEKIEFDIEAVTHPTPEIDSIEPTNLDDHDSSAYPQDDTSTDPI
jgi:hypothetical protein